MGGQHNTFAFPYSFDISISDQFAVKFIGCGEVANKEMEFVNKQPAEASLEKTTTEQIILPDGKEQDGSE